MSPETVGKRAGDYDVQAGIQHWGNRIFDLMDAAEPPSFFSRKGFYASLMEWAMRDEHFKTQLFRFVDVLGETVVSEREAEEYAGRYLSLLDLLGREIPKWKETCQSNESSRGPAPALNLSVKISAFYSQIQPTDPERALERISARLRPILRRAKELRGLINFDMEHYGLKELTLSLFKKLFSEPEFADGPACGLALQAYLKDCGVDLKQIIGWAREQKRRVTIRLVKGAYWDYETVVA